MKRLQQAIDMRREGDIAESTALLESIEEKDGRIYFECAWNYSILANARQAIDNYKQAIEQGLPKDLLKKAYMDLACNYFELHQYKQAERILDKGICEFGDSEAFRAMATIADYKLGKPKHAIVDLMQLLLDPKPSKEIAKYKTELMHYVQR
ncbi:tetratricopeptide repeat protein [Filibacter tadaridae]|uniref:Tetratrico peptide repeat protein n=1 Tax=Filibacter tadaridae TaxID=2483811 RepID=A0A3P5XD53_9BACL|nr:tetratricopeptide repeat protein [Filibacter tadaridae]VDC28159.1 Tetratrico peptide repeat protein [Filibacter tadaridae]